MPFINGGGGATFDGGTVHNPTVIDVAALATAGGLTIQGTSGANVDRLKVDFLHQLLELTGDGVLTISSDDAMGATIEGTANSGAALSVTDTPANTSAALSATASGGSATVSGPAFATLAGMSYLWGLMTALNTAPADGNLQAGQCALWFDQTNGAAALNIKAKQANGTVKTATIPVIT